MPLFRKNHNGRCEDLARRIELAVEEVDATFDLPSDWEVLKEDTGRWTKELRILMDHIHQKGGLPVGNDGGETDAVFNALTAGMDNTIDVIRKELTNPPNLQTFAALEYLRGRIALHTESTALITGHFDRWCFKFTPNGQMELNKLTATYFDQKADLEARLKNAFQCTSHDLLASQQSQENIASLSFASTNPPEIPSSESSYFLKTLKREAEKSFLDSPTSMAFEIVLRISIYLLDLLQLSLDEIPAGSTDKVKVTQLYVNLHKCGWVVHNLINHYASRTNSAGAIGTKQINELILEKLSRAFGIYDKYTSRPAPSDINSCDISLRDPFAPLISSGEPDFSPGLDHSLEGNLPLPDSADSNTTFSVSTIESTATIPARDVRSGRDENNPFETPISPHELEIEEPMTLLTASFNGNPSLEKQRWISSKVRIFQDQSNQKFRILISQEDSLLRQMIVDSETDEIVHGYSFRSNPPVLWFRQRSNECPIYFSMHSEIADLTDFASCFSGDDFEGYFPSISEINIQGKKPSSSRLFSKPTAEIWTLVDSGSRRDSTQSLQSVQSQSSDSTLSMHRKDSIEAIGERVEASRIMFFCGSSIVTVFVTDQINLRRDDAKSLTLCCKAKGSTFLPVSITCGTEIHPAGITLSSRMDSRDILATESKDYSSIGIKFSRPEGADELEKEFTRCIQRFQAKAAKLKAQRNLQRNPIIESKSHFH